PMPIPRTSPGVYHALDSGSGSRPRGAMGMAMEPGPAGAADAAGRQPVIETTGIAGLDAILGGGLARGSLALLVGPPGTGKTTLAAQMAFAAGAAGRRVLFVTVLAESTHKLLAHLRTYAFYDAGLV